MKFGFSALKSGIHPKWIVRTAYEDSPGLAVFSVRLVDYLSLARWASEELEKIQITEEL